MSNKVANRIHKRASSLTNVDFSGCTDLSFNSFGDQVFQKCINIKIVDITNSGLKNQLDAQLDNKFKKSNNSNNIEYIGNVFSMRFSLK